MMVDNNCRGWWLTVMVDNDCCCWWRLTTMVDDDWQRLLLMMVGNDGCWWWLTTMIENDGWRYGLTMIVEGDGWQRWLIGIMMVDNKRTWNEPTIHASRPAGLNMNQTDILKPKKDITAAFHKYLAVILGERTEAAEDAMFTRKVKDGL